MTLALLSTAQHVSDVNTSIFRSLRLLVALCRLTWGVLRGGSACTRIPHHLYSNIKMMHGPIRIKKKVKSITKRPKDVEKIIILGQDSRVSILTKLRTGYRETQEMFVLSESSDRLRNPPPTKSAPAASTPEGKWPLREAQIFHADVKNSLCYASTPT